ncbi:hypothetical protein COEREDRAFT_78698 [Coemansia reversa NRRL 1564]|uniref:Eukaryotic translation initiation factor SUI1 family protein n=1 Tax=Coemansia reversa (strain ATCC 12441 / NRRL 1564) TaxID=763665 RepID=A0A2G5B0X5_COERN|nr:hypothetical protein COEREDRAFT_78698 [Coemansia reversa NRRL 1564]|eukprot:PIA12675.1 hypothetical protein COEREDRAFT_78698 [Coemansia reversa NRRL 1564]
MFKKPFQTKPQSSLKHSSCRRLAQESREKFPLAWKLVEQSSGLRNKEASEVLSSAVVIAPDETPMPGKLQTAKFISHIGDKGEILYNDLGEPLWVKAEISGSSGVTLLPTVYTQWQFPGILPVIWTSALAVERLIGGADLMTPGLIVPEGGLPDLKKGELVAVCCPGNLAAHAIGTLAVDTKDIHRDSGAKGKAVLIAHTYRDHLWGSGSKAELPEIGSSRSTLPASNTASMGEGSSSSSTFSDSVNDGTTNPDTLNKGVGKDNFTSNILPAEMDSLLMTALKQVMSTVLDKRHATDLLPINASTLYSGYLVSNGPQGLEIDVKRSSYKKLAKFLKAAEKHGLVKLKDIRGETHVKELNWGHADLAQYQPYKVCQETKSKPQAKERASKQQQYGADGNGDNMGKIRVAELFRPSHALAPLFEDAGAQSESGFFTRQQARGVLEAYIKERGLVDANNPRMVKLDHRLCDGLLSKDEYAKLSTLPRDKLQARLQEKMTLYTQLLVPGRPPAVKIGRSPVVDVICEKKMGNKVITRIVGLETYAIDPTAIAKELRIKCASSTTTDPVPGKKECYAVIVQGHQVNTVSKLLERHGLPLELLQIMDKSGKAKTKKLAAGR